MPDFELTSPEGKTYVVSGPSGATKEQAFGVLQQQLSSGKATEKPAESAKAPDSKPLAVIGNTITKAVTRPFTGLVDLSESAINQAGQNLQDPLGTKRLKGEAGSNLIPPGSSFGSTPRVEAPTKYGPIRPEGVPTSEWGKKAQDFAADWGPAALTGAYGLGKGALNLGKTLIGSDAAAARKAAISGVSESVGSEAERLGQKAGSFTGESADMQMTNLGRQSELENLKAVNPKTTNLAIGQETRKSVLDAAKGYEDARQEAYGPVKDAAVAQADAKFKAGAQIEFPTAAPEMRKFLESIEGNSALETKAKGYLKMLLGEAPEAETAAPKIILTNARGVPKPPPPVAEVPPTSNISQRSPENIMNAIRQLQDVAYSGEMEGWGAFAKGSARDIVKAAKKDLYAYEPMLGEATDLYREMSEPLRAMSTKYGRAIEGMEKATGKSTFFKVDEADLPGRIFSKKGGVDMMKDILGGTPEASAKVDELTARWLSEKVRQSTAAEAKEALQVPGMQSIMSRGVQEQVVPGVTKKAILENQIAGSERGSANLEKLSRQVRRKSELLKTKLSNAEALMGRGDKTSIKEAYSEYKAALNAAGLSREEFNAANDLIGRANTIEEKTAQLRKIFAYSLPAGLGGLGYGIHQVVK
jgi:hypothetical protein